MTNRPLQTNKASLQSQSGPQLFFWKIRRWLGEFELKGTSSEIGIRENARIRLLNRFYLGLIPLLTSVFFINLFLYDSIEGAALIAVLICFSLISLLSSRRGHYVLARWLIILPVILILTALAYFFGRPAGGSISFLVIALSIIVLFSSWKSRLALLGILAIAFIFSEWYLYHYDPIIETKNYVDLLPPLVFTSNFVTMIVLLLYFEEIVFTAQKRSTKLLQDLQEKNERLRLTNYQLAHFAQTSSNHFKAPLKNISNILGLLERRLPDEVTGSVGPYIDLVKGNSRHLYKLVEDILLYSNVEDAIAEEDIAPIAISGVLDNIILNLHSFLSKHQAHVVLEEDFEVKMAPSHLELLLQNLIQNGIKYNESSQPQVKIRKVADADDSLLVFAIEDNGLGIAKEYHEKIFGMFSRLHPDDEYEGTGIGLAVCRKIMLLYKGMIKVNSEVGKGTTFFVTLQSI